jgi:ABC-type amino acid transport system permease subunit
VDTTTSDTSSLLQNLRPTTRLTLAIVLLGWLLLQVILLMLSNLPGMAEVARTITLLIAAAVPLTAWLLVVHFPDADVSPESLKFLLMVAAMGFAAAAAMRWALTPDSDATINS